MSKSTKLENGWLLKELLFLLVMYLKTKSFSHEKNPILLLDFSLLF